MSSTDDASSRLSHALEEILAKAAPTADWSVDDEPAAPADEASTAPDETSEQAAVGENGDGIAASDVDEPTAAYVLPEIVPATVEPEPKVVVPPVVSPTLPPTAHSKPEVAPRPPPVTAPTPAASTPAAPTPAAKPATSWADHMSAPIQTGSPGAALRAPGRRPRVRRVTRVLRHIDPWSTFKVGLLFSAVAYVVCLTAGVLLWQVADSTGTLDNVERWFTQFGWETFELKGGEVFHNAWIIGLFGVVAVTGGLVLLATLFNLVSDIVGGVRMTVLEEEVVERTITSTRRYVVRRPPLGADAGGEAATWDVDDDEASAGEPKRHAESSNASAPSAVAADWSVDDDESDAAVADPR